MLRSGSIEFHLECEGAACPTGDDFLWQKNGPDDADPHAARPDVLGVPSSGVSFLTSSDDEDRHPRLTLEVPQGPAVVLETATFGGRPVLAAVRGPDDESRVNATFMPRPALLGPGDCLQLPNGPVLRVRMFARPEIGPPPDELVGKPCAYCRTPIVGDTTVWVCHHCRAALHCEDAGPPDRRLQCARLTPVCPSCTHPVLLQEGYIATAES